VAKRADILPTAQSKDKNDNEQSNMVSKSDIKNLFQSSLKEMLTKRTNKRRRRKTLKAMMNHWIWMFLKLMEGKHTTIVNKIDVDLKSINDTDTFDYS
jgi:ribosomal protein L13